MTAKNMLTPDYLFEVSWEVCNKVGGIYTVISTKAPLLDEKFNDNYLLIGPDVFKDTNENGEFIEDQYSYKLWREQALEEGLKFRIGRWNITDKPLVILVDFTQLFAEKDKIFEKLWEKYGLDSYYGQWDYVEPALFGIAAGRVIKSFYEFHVFPHENIVAQFHEWMTGTGILYLNEHTPQIGTIFTTHATVLGRSIAGNRMPLYSQMHTYHSESLAKTMGVVSKFSLERISAGYTDCFTTVSEITAKECEHFLAKKPDIITPNGFDGGLIPDNEQLNEKRNQSRLKIKKITEGLINQNLPDDTVFIMTSGRYEFYNKGIDLFIDAMGRINNAKNSSQTIIAVIAVPGNHAGASQNLINRMKERDFSQPVSNDYCTHYLHHYKSDAMIQRIAENNLNNSPADKVKIVIVPCYLDEKDGIIDINYYDFLTAFDLTVFPSYYEPWGYTPLESIAFHIPTITTTLAGFGLWVLSQDANPHEYISVIQRTDDNHDFVLEELCRRIISFVGQPDGIKSELREKAYDMACKAFWQNMLSHYDEAFSIALLKASGRYEQYKNKITSSGQVVKPKQIEPPSWRKVLVKPTVPENFKTLLNLTKNLWWTWNPEAVELFSIIKPKVWEQSNHNPIALLGSLTLDDYKKLEKNQAFLNKLQIVSNAFCNYMNKASEKQGKLISYFSMEFGLHDSIKTYSGGLGILAGDFLKEASDSNANIIGISLLYRYGYFDQSVSLLGDQLESYHPQKYSLLPLIPVFENSNNGEGNNKWLKIQLPAPGRIIYAKIWRVEVGRVTLFLLDTDLEENHQDDRMISHRLYGGDNELRFKQELMLGIGGIRALEALNIKPDIYHCNEGHAAFMCIERLHKLVQEENLTFLEAVEAVKASTLFTTHTPVPAGHDKFSEDIIRTYIRHYAELLRIDWETFMAMGRVNENDSNEEFNMSILATRLSSEINGVSKIHGRVTSKLLSPLFQGYFHNELNIGYVTNGVHYPTWVGKRWKNLYDETFDKEYINHQSEHEYWKKFYDVPDETIWKIRQEQRADLINFVRDRVVKEMTLRQENPQNIFKVSESLNNQTLTIGFARRFATYKRAQLLFNNPERLAAILKNKKRPVQFLFAGKAHPHDGAGKEILKQIYQLSQNPEFVGKIIFVENYDINLGKKLTQGVDIWLNTPTRPEEASGTSGMKAVMNGALNFSVLDGWWAEGYVPNAGWALNEERTYKNQQAQNALDAVTIYNMLENVIIPMFYERSEKGIPEKWIQYIKNSVTCIAPRFTMKRMLDDYYEKFYTTLSDRTELMNAEHFKNARRLASWKQKILRGWESIEVVSLNITDSNKKPLLLGETFSAEVVLSINELNENDIGVELLFAQKVNDVVEKILFRYDLQILKSKDNVVTYYHEMPAELVGVYDFIFRIYPKNPLLAHKRDFSVMKWV